MHIGSWLASAQPNDASPSTSAGLVVGGARWVTAAVEECLCAGGLRGGSFRCTAA